MYHLPDLKFQLELDRSEYHFLASHHLDGRHARAYCRRIGCIWMSPLLFGLYLGSFEPIGSIVPSTAAFFAMLLTSRLRSVLALLIVVLWRFLLRSLKLSQNN